MKQVLTFLNSTTHSKANLGALGTHLVAMISNLPILIIVLNIRGMLKDKTNLNLTLQNGFCNFPFKMFGSNVFDFRRK